MSSPIIGNFISAIPARPGQGLDVYCMDVKPNVLVPSVTVLHKDASSKHLVQTVTFLADGAYRYSRIAVNRRDFADKSQQASVFFQAVGGQLLEYRILANGTRYYYGVDNVPAQPNAIAPAFGSSLATVTSGVDLNTAFVFYQASDNKIYFIQQTAFGVWSYPTLVTEAPTQEPTTLSAFGWAETDKNASSITDVVCLAFNPNPGRYVVFMRRELRPGSKTACTPTLTPRFECVLDVGSPLIRGPFAALYKTGLLSNGCCGYEEVDGQYAFYTQLAERKPGIWEGQVLKDGDASLDFLQWPVVSPPLGTPARGTSIAAVYYPTNDDEKETDIVTVVYSNPLGCIEYETLNDTERKELRDKNTSSGAV